MTQAEAPALIYKQLHTVGNCPPQDTVINRMLLESKEDYREYTAEELRMIQAQDMERLRKMEGYCTTAKCLRAYILNYFGENAEETCGNCSNCLTQFETVDVTELAKGIAGCVESSRQRYGINVIIDTIHGANTAKIRGYRMDENPHYGELAKVPTYKLRQVFNHLLMEGYLSLTNDEFAIVKLTEKSRGLLDEEETVLMKMAKEQESAAKTQKMRKGRAGAAAGEMGEGEQSLFERLRALRTQIAREEKVPPYIVFSDKTLVDMCMKKPRTREEMLAVSGVGEFKYGKYGERFLQCVGGENVG